MSLGVPLTVYIYLNLFALPEQLRMLMTSINSKLSKHFLNHRSHFKLLETYHVSLKKLLQPGISNQEVYGKLVFKFKKIIRDPNFSNLFKRTVNRFKGNGYTLNIMRQTACLMPSFYPNQGETMLYPLVERWWFWPQTQ